MQEALKIELKVSYWLNTTLPDYEKRLSLKSRLPDETIPRMMLIVGGSCRILVLELLKSRNIILLPFLMYGIEIFGRIGSLCNSIRILEKCWTKVCLFPSLQAQRFVTFAR
jgi:hypothetical protein